MPEDAYITVPVTNLRRQPAEEALSYDSWDPMQESQLLYGERVHIVDKQAGWCRIHAVEQPKFDSHKWIGYPGWVRADHLKKGVNTYTQPLLVCDLWADVYDLQGNVLLSLSLGTRLEGIKKQGPFWAVQLLDGTQGVIASSKVAATIALPHAITLMQRMRHHPYLWGGLSSYRPAASHTLTGVDCSSLTWLMYRLCGMPLPRDAHDQALQCAEIQASHIRPGDLVFLPDTKVPNRFGHVMVYLDEERLFEAVRQYKCVREITFKDKIGVSLQQLKQETSSSRTGIWFGRPRLARANH